MQRPTPDNSATPPHQLAPADTGGYYPPTQALAPGQMFAPSATARGWPTLPELVNALKRRLVLATFLGLLVGVGAAAAVWLALPNGKHEVRALLDVSPGATNNGEGAFEAFKQKQEALIRTRLLLDRVLANSDVAKLKDVQSSEDAVRYLEENIKVSWAAHELMRVRMSGDDPNQLRTILDTLIVEYIKDSNTSDTNARKANQVRMQAALDKLNGEIERREKVLKQLSVINANPNPEMTKVFAEVIAAQLKTALNTTSNLNLSLPKKRQDLQAVEDRLKTINDAPVNEDEINAALGKTPEFQDKYQDLARVEARLAEASARAPRPDTPAVLAEQSSVRAAREALRAATVAVRPQFERAFREALRKEAEVKRRDIAEAIATDEFFLKQNQALEKTLTTDLEKLSRGGLVATLESDDLKPIKERRNKVSQDILNLEFANDSEPRIQKREGATIYLNQTLKQKVLLSIFALVAGTTVLMLAVAFLEWRSRRVDSVDQVVSELGLRVIGTIPAFPSKQALKNGDAATSQNWRFVLNESVNSARTMLLHTAKTQNMQVLMVTSAMQGEGKTSLASQLATSMATAGLRTLILDCDLRNPSMHKLFDAPLTPGCSEVLCQEVDVSDAVQPTAVPNLWLIPAGQCSNRVISALAQGHPLETLFNRLRGQFDFIVVDSCPVLPVADSLLVGQHVDGVLISILQDISQLPKVQQVSERLTDLNIPLLGAVVNGIKPDIHAYGYNYVKQLPA